MVEKEHVVIIGNGISGITAARHIRKRSDVKITVISKETKFFYSRTALMYVYMGHMLFEHTQPYEDWFWDKNNIELIQDTVTDINFNAKEIHLKNSGDLPYSKLIIATGSKPNKFGWKGEDSSGVQGLYHKQDLEKLEAYTDIGIHRGVIVGGGLIGVELAEMLHTRDIPVTFLVRENRFWKKFLSPLEAKMIEDELIKHNIDLRLETEMEEIIPDKNGQVSEVVTKNEDKIECNWVGLAAGVSPNIDFLKNTVLEIDRGVLVNEYLQTNINDVYAIGDCAQFKAHPDKIRPSIEQVWYTGKIMGSTVAKTICGIKTQYSPGIWFNSAKFFNIEYQTYGWVHSEPKEDELHFEWKHSSENLLVRIAFHKETRVFLGINTFGIRMNHLYFEKWLQTETSVEEVLTNLTKANFDPEFYKLYEVEIIEKFNRDFNTNIQLKKRSWKNLFTNG